MPNLIGLCDQHGTFCEEGSVEKKKKENRVKLRPFLVIDSPLMI